MRAFACLDTNLELFPHAHPGTHPGTYPGTQASLIEPLCARTLGF